jgi:hypothetical protein
MDGYSGFKVGICVNQRATKASVALDLAAAKYCPAGL